MRDFLHESRERFYPQLAFLILFPLPLFLFIFIFIAFIIYGRQALLRSIEFQIDVVDSRFQKGFVLQELLVLLR